MPHETPSQTAGPYLHIGCTPHAEGIWPERPDLGQRPFPEGQPGEWLTINGRVLDGAGEPVTDAMVETWQADAEGRFAAQPGDGLSGWSRMTTDAETGIYAFDTIRPGGIVDPEGLRHASHILVWIVARGVNIGLQTRIYFPEDKEAHAIDPVLMAIADQERKPTLIARKEDDQRYRFDIHLQGPAETIFFDM